MFRSKAVLACAVALLLGYPLAAAAQGGRDLIINQVQVSERSWPEVTLNLTLLGSDGRAVGDVDASQFQVSEQGVPQALQGLELGPARSVPLAMVVAIDVSGS